MASMNSLPDGFHTVTPYLICTNASRLIEFAKVVFDAEVILKMPDSTGAIRHAQIRIGDSMLELADANAEWPAMPASLHVYVQEVDSIYVRSLAAGAVSLQSPRDQFYGERSASVKDPVGNVWHLATRTEELTQEEMIRRAAAQGSEG